MLCVGADTAKFSKTMLSNHSLILEWIIFEVSLFSDTMTCHKLPYRHTVLPIHQKMSITKSPTKF